MEGVQFDDGGGHRVPLSWRVLYREADQWKPVEALEDYTQETDTYNEVSLEPNETDGLKLEVELGSGVSSGIQEWRVLPSEEEQR